MTGGKQGAFQGAGAVGEKRVFPYKRRRLRPERNRPKQREKKFEWVEVSLG